jgi:hypothetical protein
MNPIFIPKFLLSAFVNIPVVLTSYADGIVTTEDTEFTENDEGKTDSSLFVETRLCVLCVLGGSF